MTAIVIIAGLAGILWATIFVLRGSLVGGCLVFLLVACCFGHKLLEFDLGPVPLTLDRAVLVVLVLAYLVRRWLGRTAPGAPGLAGVDLLVAIFAGLLAVSTFTHKWQVTNAEQISPVWRLITGYLMPMTVYWIARQAPLSDRQVGWVQGSLAAFGVYLAVTGLAEVSGQWWLVFPKYIADPTVGIHFGRARGPMLQSACFGTLLAICFLAAWLWRARLGRGGQLLLVMLFPLYLAGIYVTYTRSNWAETALGLMIVLGMTLVGRWRVCVLGSMAAAGLMVGIAKWDSLVGFKREHTAEDTRKSVHMRGSFAYASWLMFQDRPLWGCGFGQYPAEVLPYLSDRSTDVNLESIRGYVHHNTPLCILVETGLVGLVVFLGVLGGWARAAWIVWRSPQTPDWARSQAVLLIGALAMYFCEAVFHDVTYTALENLLLFFLAGITVALRPLASPSPNVAPAPASASALDRRHAGVT